jgi:hypothetical protein
MNALSKIRTHDPNVRVSKDSSCFRRIHTFLISALDGGDWSASHPGRFTPGERAPGTHWIEGWVGLREKKILDPTGTTKFW